VKKFGKSASIWRSNGQELRCTLFWLLFSITVEMWLPLTITAVFEESAVYQWQAVHGNTCTHAHTHTHDDDVRPSNVQRARRRLQHHAVEHEQGTVRHIRRSGHPLHLDLSPVVLTMSCHWTQIGKDERVRLMNCATLPHYNPIHAQVTTFSAAKVLW